MPDIADETVPGPSDEAQEDVVLRREVEQLVAHHLPDEAQRYLAALHDAIYEQDDVAVPVANLRRLADWLEGWNETHAPFCQDC
jgi:hypothetical protein